MSFFKADRHHFPLLENFMTTNSAKRVSRRHFIAATSLISLSTLMTLASPNIALAYDEQSKAAVNVDAKGVAMRGYDPVSYFSQGGPSKGDARFTAALEGATYWFANASNRDTFKSSPAKYAPVFGGFCAMGVAMEKKLDGDPLLWRVEDGKLYLNVQKAVQTRFLEDIKGNVAKANANWPTIKTKAPKEL